MEASGLDLLDCFRAAQELDERLGRRAPVFAGAVGIIRRRAAAGHEHDRALEFGRVGHELHARHAADLVLGLDREVGLALGDALGVVAAAAARYEHAAPL